MNSDDSHRARSVADLARMLPVPAERAIPAGRRHLVKEHLMTELRTDQPATHRAPRAQRPRRTAWKVAGAGLLAATAAAASVIGLTGNAASSGGHIIAATLLRQAADVAGGAPVQEVTDNQFMYIKTEIAAGTPFGERPRNAPPTASLDSGSRSVRAWPGNRQRQEV